MSEQVTQTDIKAALSHLGWDDYDDFCAWAIDNHEMDRFDQLVEAFARHRRETLEEAANYIEGAGGVIPGTSVFAGLVAGNSQPDMSGDMRNRLQPPQRRMFDSITRQLAQAIRNLK